MKPGASFKRASPANRAHVNSPLVYVAMVLGCLNTIIIPALQAELFLLAKEPTATKQRMSLSLELSVSR